MSYIYASYKHFMCSSLSDFLVLAGVMLKKSVEQSLREKHYRQ